jgi:hypothetical protein
MFLMTTKPNHYIGCKKGGTNNGNKDKTSRKKKG